MNATIETRPHRINTPQDISAAQDPDALLTVHTVAALTGFTIATIREWAREGRFPAPMKMGPRTVRWRAREVREWLHDPQGWKAAQAARASGAAAAGSAA